MNRYVKYRVEESPIGKFHVIKDEKGRSSIILASFDTRGAAIAYKNKHTPHHKRHKRNVHRCTT